MVWAVVDFAFAQNAVKKHLIIAAFVARIKDAQNVMQSYSGKTPIIISYLKKRKLKK
jgi:hypothetical protein